MDSIHDQQYYRAHASKHKMTTMKQYSLLKSKMAKLIQKNQNCYKNNNTNGVLRYKQDNIFWKELTEQLNSLGPPYRTVQQWKKVWCDFKRSERKRSGGKSTTKLAQYIKDEDNDDNELDDDKFSETANSSKLGIDIKSETKDDNIEQNFDSMCTSFSNNYDNDYSYPDEDSLHESFVDPKDIFIGDESSCGSYTFANKTALGKSNNQQANNAKHFTSPPPLQPSNLPMQDQSMYTLQNQMEHQTKVLEHLFQMSNTMVNLMERQVDAIEKQAETIHRQALATERHTSAMNNFIDMIRDKMFRGNSPKSTVKSTNDIL